MSNRLASIADAALEATIVGSFSTIGHAVRSRLDRWDPPTADLRGQRVLVTGATSGIGRATARSLMDLGADVVVTSRDQERADQAASELEDEAPAGGATGMAVDTADLDSVMELADRLGDGPPLDVMIHNAGALTAERHTNDAGMEVTLASHLVGPYLLTRELRPHLTDGARVLWMSSGGMYTQGLDVDRLEMSESSYRGSIAYARAKRAQVELVAHLGPRWAPEVIMHAVHPGWVDTPGVEQGLPGFRTVTRPILRQPHQGADTMVWLAVTGGDGAPAGSFWHDRRTRGTAYLPGTGTDDDERQALLEWLELHTLPATVTA